MNARQVWPAVVVFTVAGIFAGCARAPKSPDVSDAVRKSLDAAGLRNIHVSQDRDKGVVTLSGNVQTDEAKLQAANIARSVAQGQVVADEVAVLPPGNSDARQVNADLDKGIEKNVDAALLQNNLHDYVHFSVKNGVVTLTGNVDSQLRRRDAQEVAAAVPNVQQVVNELQVKDQKASSSY